MLPLLTQMYLLLALPSLSNHSMSHLQHKHRLLLWHRCVCGCCLCRGCCVLREGCLQRPLPVAAAGPAHGGAGQATEAGGSGAVKGWALVPEAVPEAGGNGAVDGGGGRGGRRGAEA